MIRKKILLRSRGEILKDNVAQTIEDVPRCSNGRTREQYEDLGIAVPQEIIDKEQIEFKDDDFENLYGKVVIYEDEIKFIIREDDEDTTIIYLKEGITIIVEDTVEEILQKLNN